MRQLARNKRRVWFCLYQGKTAVLDDDGNATGEYRVEYSSPAVLRVNVGSAKGTSAEEMFGTDISYDHILTLSRDVAETDGIDENTVFFIDHEPSDPYHEDYDYRVVRISSTINETAIAVAKVRL